MIEILLIIGGVFLVLVIVAVFNQPPPPPPPTWQYFEMVKGAHKITGWYRGGDPLSITIGEEEAFTFLAHSSVYNGDITTVSVKEIE